MTHSFNLVEQPWIPCTKKSGESVVLGLRQILCEAHELIGIQGDNPLVTAALYRILLAVLHRIFGPPDAAAWHALWQAGKWDAIALETYFQKWMGRFDLFDPVHLFLQDPSCQRKPKGVASLLQGVAAGADATLFSHHTDLEDLWLSPAEAGRALVAAQAFGLGGIAGSGLAFTDAPCCRLVVFLVQGNNLFETLVLNLVRYPLPDGRIQHSESDRPSWEMDDPNRRDPARPWGYLDYLTWHNRSVRLIPEYIDEQMAVRSMLYGPGLKLEAVVLNPMAQFFKNKQEGYRALRFSENQRLWRDSIALMELKNSGSEGPYQIDWLARLASEDYVPRHAPYYLIAFGMATEPGKDKVYFLRQERLPLPLDYLTQPELVEQLRDFGLGYVQAGKTALRRALLLLAGTYLNPNLNPKEKKWELPKEVDSMIAHWGSERWYWAELEQPYFHLVMKLPEQKDAAIGEWKQAVQEAARQAFSDAEASLADEPRAWKAVVRGRSQLNMGLARLNSEEKGGNNERIEL